MVNVPFNPSRINAAMKDCHVALLAADWMTADQAHKIIADVIGGTEKDSHKQVFMMMRVMGWIEEAEDKGFRATRREING